MMLLAILVIVIAVEWFALRATKLAFSELMFRNGLGSASVLIEACRTVYGFQVLREFERESRLIFASESIPESIGPGDVEKIAKQSQLPLVVFTDFDANIIFKSSSTYNELFSWLNTVKTNLHLIYDNTESTQLFGIDRELPLEEGPKGLAIRVKNGVIILFAPEPTSREREELTLGRMIGRLGENPEVRYLALQDTSGFIFATKTVRKMSSLTSDEFLQKVVETGEANSRYADFSGERVFELALNFPQMGRYKGILRIGFSAADYDRLFRGYAFQIGAILVLVLIAAGGIIALSMTTRRLSAQVGLSEAIVSEMNAACLAINPSGKISLINPVAVKLFGLSSREICGKSYVATFPEDILGLQKVLKTKRAYIARTEIKTPSGVRLLDISANKLVEGGAFAVAEDITDIIELKKEAASVEHLRALGELTAGVAHEIRNPLNAIGIVAQRLSAEFTPMEDEVEYLDMLKNLRVEISRLDNIVREFIGLSAPLAPNLSFKPIDPLLAEIEAAGRLRAEGSGIDFESKIDFSGHIEFDDDQLKKALLNLIKNAVEATPKGGKIKLKAYKLADELCISVWDSGPPVPNKIIEKLGKPFVSAGKEGGTGIGLFVTFRVAKDHGGRIEVDTGENGTDFRCVLPIPTKGRK